MQDETRASGHEHGLDYMAGIVLQLMLKDRSPGLWSAGELEQAVGSPVATADALAELHATGLVHRHGEFVWPTRAAMKAIQIEEAWS